LSRLARSFGYKPNRLPDHVAIFSNLDLNVPERMIVGKPTVQLGDTPNPHSVNHGRLLEYAKIICNLESVFAASQCRLPPLMQLF